MDSLSVSAYMVEIGGEVRVKGEKAPGQPWQIGIERPVADKSTNTVIEQLREDCAEDLLSTVIPRSI